MAYPTLNEVVNTSEGIHTLFIYTAHIVPIFIPLVLLAFFVIILLGTFFAQERLRGRGDFVASFTVAGYVTFIVASVMSLVENLISSITVITSLIVALIGTLWLFISRKE